MNEKEIADHPWKSLVDQNFGQYFDITEDVYAFLLERLKPKSFDAHDLIVEGGAIERNFYLVQSGVQAIYVISSKGEKVILGFSFEGFFSGVYDSFIHQKPSSLFLEALTTSTLLALSKADFDLLFEQYPSFYQWRVKLIENIFFGRLTREVEVLTKTAKERFDAFMKRCPPQLLTIPQKYLASYLNMTPETFSRLRAARE